MTHLATIDASDLWEQCRFLTCSVLPVRVACNCRCSFCFSRSSVSALKHEPASWRSLDVGSHYRWAASKGANRLVVTGGGEPLLRPDDTKYLIEEGAAVFDEIACFTNGALLTGELAGELSDAGLGYLCFSRHAVGEGENRELMGPKAPTLDAFFAAAGDLKVRATCVMARGYVETTEDVWRYIDALKAYGVREFTFKHTYVAYERSMFRDSPQNAWARDHKIEFDPFAGQGTVLAKLPWGPEIRRIGEVQVCYYREPTPEWELRNQLCRSTNLLSDGSVYASLEDRQSLLYQLRH